MFASALDWPGWCRPGRSEQQALETLAAYAGRYAEVFRGAGLHFEIGSAEFDVVERAPGNVTTDVGAPAVVAAAETEPLDDAGGRRITSVVASLLAVSRPGRPPGTRLLRKGPQGGGRGRDEIVDHVAAAELSYARKLGIRLGSDLPATRVAIVEVLAAPSDGSPLDTKRWPARCTGAPDRLACPRPRLGDRGQELRAGPRAVVQEQPGGDSSVRAAGPASLPVTGRDVGVARTYHLGLPTVSSTRAWPHCPGEGSGTSRAFS